MNRKEKKTAKQKQYTRQLINTKGITDYSLLTVRGDELVYFIIKPTNISVLSEESVSARIYSLMNPKFKLQRDLMAELKLRNGLTFAFEQAVKTSRTTSSS
jgi:hypothetical protein